MTKPKQPMLVTRDRNGACFIVKDKTGFALAPVCIMRRRQGANLLTHDEARALRPTSPKLPELLPRY